ncbi:MAG: YcxB family protein [Clostridia bacterium]|nr:YcxB family protein [Clostridia bacterium]
MKKHGKLPYTAESTVEFYDDKFISRSENKTTEMPYTEVENVCDNTNHAIYIYTDVQTATIIPYKCFRDDSEREDFLNFIKQKVNI